MLHSGNIDVLVVVADGGGGGRILVMRVSDTSALSLTNAAGGTSGAGINCYSQTGTVVFVQLPQPGTILFIK